MRPARPSANGNPAGRYRAVIGRATSFSGITARAARAATSMIRPKIEPGKLATHSPSDTNKKGNRELQRPGVAAPQQHGGGHEGDCRGQPRQTHEPDPQIADVDRPVEEARRVLGDFRPAELPRPGEADDVDDPVEGHEDGERPR